MQKIRAILVLRQLDYGLTILDNSIKELNVVLKYFLCFEVNRSYLIMSSWSFYDTIITCMAMKFMINMII